MIRISVCAIASLILSQSLLAEAATTEQDQSIAPAAKPTLVVPQAKETSVLKAPTGRLPARMRERPGFKMTCPDANEVTLHLSYVGGWSLEPTQLRPAAFTRAYGQIDSADKSKVSLACLYQVTGDCVATVSYNGLQQCYVNSSGEGMISYTGPVGFKMNVAGTSALGRLPVKKTGERIQTQKLECQLHAEGEAQFFKKYQAEANLSTCEANGREVTCRY